MLIPNQEWFKKSRVGKIPDFDAVFCKSRLAERIFEDRRGAVRDLSASPHALPRLGRGESPDFSRFLHIAGRSFMKGTRVVVEAWSRHPEWPALTILGTGGHELGGLPPNVLLIDRYRTKASVSICRPRMGFMSARPSRRAMVIPLPKEWLWELW